VGTAIVHDPSACSRVARELEEELAALGADRVADVIGQAHGAHVRAARGLVNGPRRAQPPDRESNT
jgi:dihydroorotate dehydrogenase (NAD+) catalytic subunit